MSIEKISQEIVKRSQPILDKYVPAKYTLELDYVDIFPKSKDEHAELLKELKTLGKAVWPGSTGYTYKLHSPIQTVKGDLWLLRVRIFDESKIIFRGHPDYAVAKAYYENFKEDMMKQENVNLIRRPAFDMVEIWDENFEVAIYFPSISLTEDVNKKLEKLK